LCRWNINEGLYLPSALKAKERCQTFSKLSGQWIPRELNTVADALSKAPLQKVSIRLGKDEQDPYDDRNDESVW